MPAESKTVYGATGTCNDEVKPCPCCGGRAAVKWVKQNVGFRHWITCTVCHLKTPMRRDKPIELWNKRTHDTIMGEVTTRPEFYAQVD